MTTQRSGGLRARFLTRLTVRDGPVCRGCGREFDPADLDVDHRIGLADDGTDDDFGNLQLLCAPRGDRWGGCHGAKSRGETSARAASRRQRKALTGAGSRSKRTRSERAVYEAPRTVQGVVIRPGSSGPARSKARCGPRRRSRSEPHRSKWRVPTVSSKKRVFSKTKSTKPPTGPKTVTPGSVVAASLSTRWFLTVVGVGFVLAGGANLLGVGEARIVAGLAGMVLALTTVLTGRVVRVLRTGQRRRITEAFSAESGVATELLRASVTGWSVPGIGTTPTGFSVRYPPSMNDRDAGLVSRVETCLAAKMGSGFRASWHPDRDTVVFRFAPESGDGSSPSDEPSQPGSHTDSLGSAEVGVVEALAAEFGKGRDPEPPSIEWEHRDPPVEPGSGGGNGDSGLAAIEAFTVRYRPSFPDHAPASRLAVQSRVGAKLAPVRFRPEWDTAGNKVRFERRPPMPSLISRPADDASDSPLPIGVDEFSGRAGWDYVELPHLLLVGATGSGKTIQVCGLLLSIARRGHPVYLVDGKGSPKLAGLRHWPSVVDHAIADPSEMSRVVSAVEGFTRDRYQRVLAGDRELDELEPVFLILDEVSEFVAQLKRAHTGKGEHPALGQWRSILRIGRECHVHVVDGLQQAGADVFDGTEARDNHAARVALGPMGPEAAKMAFGDASIGRDVPKLVKGRATVDLGTEPFEVQCYASGFPKPYGAVVETDRDGLAAFLPDGWVLDGEGRPTRADARRSNGDEAETSG